jgi:hypothetical protein
MTHPNVQPAEQPDQLGRQPHATEFAAGLRQFADWLEERLWLPTRRPGSDYQQPARIQIDLHEHMDFEKVRDIADRLGVKTDERLDDRTSVEVRVGSVDYEVIAWHRGGRPDEREAEIEKLRARIAELEATTDTGHGFSREADDPTPVSPARVPLHTGSVVEGDELVVDPADPKCTPECDAMCVPDAPTGLVRRFHHDDCPVVPVLEALDRKRLAVGDELVVDDPR